MKKDNLNKLNDSLDRIFESKIFATLVKDIAVGIWLASGIMVIFPLHDATLRSQWTFGFLFGLLFQSMTVYTIGNII